MLESAIKAYNGFRATLIWSAVPEKVIDNV